MELMIVGCRAGMPADGQASSGYLVSAANHDGPDTTVLLDCGPGVATALSAIMPVDALDAVVISHVHLDHCYDLLPLGKTLLSRHLHYPEAGRQPQSDVRLQRVPVYAPAGAGELFEQLAALFPVSTVPALDRAFELAFDITEYRPGDRFSVGSLEIEAHLLRHASPNCGFRVSTEDCSLAYTGDTGPTEALVPFAKDVDLLLAECTLDATDHGPHGHLSAEDAAEVATAAGVGRLVLTHFSSANPEWLAQRKARAAAGFDGPVHLAAPQATFEIGSI
jgi:ribonuclease BN (tRNA processing enzyme)